MIAIAIIIAVTVITSTSLVVANAIDKRQTPPPAPPEPEPVDHRQQAIERKRAVLERQRKAWCGSTQTQNSDMRIAATERILEIDKQLLALADEEAKL